MKKKTTRGGAREGAGRPAKTGRTETLAIRISPEAKENIKSKADETGTSASEVVDRWARKLKKRT